MRNLVRIDDNPARIAGYISIKIINPSGIHYVGIFIIRAKLFRVLAFLAKISFGFLRKARTANARLIIVLCLSRDYRGVEKTCTASRANLLSRGFLRIDALSEFVLFCGG